MILDVFMSLCAVAGGSWWVYRAYGLMKAVCEAEPEGQEKLVFFGFIMALFVGLLGSLSISAGLYVLVLIIKGAYV